MATEHVIVCAGSAVDPECARIITGSRAMDKRLFVMSEWLSDDQRSSAALLWVVDGSNPWKDVSFALQRGIPLLVPADNSSLVEICLRLCCGIWYRGELEARLCLDFLQSSDPVRVGMGANGRAYFSEVTILTPGAAPNLARSDLRLSTQRPSSNYKVASA